LSESFLADYTTHLDLVAAFYEKRSNNPGVNEIFPNYDPKMRGIFG